MWVIANAMVQQISGRAGDLFGSQPETQAFSAIRRSTRSQLDECVFLRLSDEEL
jgi:hypothetical protein